MKQKSIFTNFLWRLMERFGVQLVGFLVSIVLARLLNPSVYGTVAIVSVFLPIFQVFIDSGLGTALIQKKDPDQLDFSSVFYFNLVMCIGIYIILFFLSPLFAAFFNNLELTNIIRVASITVLISGVKSIQQSYVSCTMQFKKFFFSTLIGTVLSACIGITMAFMGFGVWALVTQSLVNNLIDTIILWITVEWRPTLAFSWERLKKLLAYGWKILFSTLVTSVYGNLRQILIGRYYTESDLAYYNKGNDLPNRIAPNIVTSIASVLLPEVSKKQDDLGEVKRLTRKANSILSFAMWPMMIGMAACGKNLYVFLLTEKWLMAVPYLQLFCFEAAIWPISAILNNSVKAIGRSDINLKIQMVVRAVGIVVLLIVIRNGPFAIALTAMAVTLLELVIVSVVNSRVIGYCLVEQLADVLPPLLIALVMGAIVIAVGKLRLYLPLCLFLQVFVGVLVYAAGAFVCKIDSLQDVLDFIRKKRAAKDDNN